MVSGSAEPGRMVLRVGKGLRPPQNFFGKIDLLKRESL